MVQLAHPYMTTGKTTALTRWTFGGKVTSLLFNMLCRFFIGTSSIKGFQFVLASTLWIDSKNIIPCLILGETEMKQTAPAPRELSAYLTVVMAFCASDSSSETPSSGHFPISTIGSSYA